MLCMRKNTVFVEGFYRTETTFSGLRKSDDYVCSFKLQVLEVRGFEKQRGVIYFNILVIKYL
jgi:hypothetical protein